nr:hypothetical protein [Kibdelosporangium phytohabitans]
MCAAGTLVAGCGIEPTGVFTDGDAPTGVAPGVTLFFLDQQGNLRPTVSETKRLGDVTQAVDLLLRLGDRNREDGLRSDLPAVGSLGPQVTVSDTVVTLLLPLARREVGPRGVDQVVCTALGVHRQSGDTRVTGAVVSFTDGTTIGPRTCPAS